jgi:ribosomal protein S18 acetylase RimI-like enzyme
VLTIRAANLDSREELELIATRMRGTLVEVLGEARGGGMYTHEWLRERARFHAGVGVVLVAATAEGVVGHAMARVEDGAGHFSTIYVEPSSRRRGVASALIDAIHAWFAERGMTTARYYTDADNAKLIALFEKHGYAITGRFEEERMVGLEAPIRRLFRGRRP